MNNFDIPAGVVAKVRQVVANDVRFVPVFREMSQRAQKRKVIDVYRLKLQLQRGGIAFNDLEFLKLFELMERAGAGKLTVREQPDHSTFDFKYTMQNLAKMASEGLSRPVSAEAGGLARGTAKKPQDGLKVVYELNGTPVTLSLPASFNVKDAEKLSGYLKTVAKLNESGDL